MKILVLILVVVAFAGNAASQDPPQEADISVRAPSTFVNCECQCDRSRFSQFGNCESPDQTGANFCFVSRFSAQACRDTKPVNPQSHGFRNRGRFISYEACTTSVNEQCFNQGFGGHGGEGGGGGGGFNNFGGFGGNGGFGGFGSNTGGFGGGGLGVPGFSTNQNGFSFNLASLLGLRSGAGGEKN